MKNQHNLFSSFNCAFRGIKIMFGTERNAQIHLGATLTVILLASILEVSSIEWGLLIVSIGLVLGAEAFNSALEQIIDLVSPNIQEKAGVAKDLAAGGVLLSAICAAIIGMLVFIPRILTLI